MIFSLNNESAEKIATLIVAEFPTEVSSTYYIPPIRKKDSSVKKPIPARGKLINIWRNRTYANRKLENTMKIADATDDSDENGEIT